jgi:hypothetical protein
MILIELDDGLLVDEETGEIVEAPRGTDALKLVALRRAEAKAQEEAWYQRRKHLDAVLLRNQEERLARYDAVTVALRQRQVETFQAERFVDLVHDVPLEHDDIMVLLGAAKGFKKEMLGDEPRLAALVAAATESRASRPWVETTITLRDVPETRRVERDD